MRVGMVFVLASVFLSGCSGGGGGGSDSDETDTPVVDPNAPIVPEEPEIVYTNRIWFSEAPDMSSMPPMLGDAARTAMALEGFGDGGGGGQGPGPQSVWEYDLEGNGTITGATLHVWIDVVEQLVNPPNPFPFGGGDCTWQAEVAFLTSGGEVLTQETSCVTESAATIPAGEHELEFDVQITTNLAPGNTLQVTLLRRPFSASQEEAVFVLSGTDAADTWIEFIGLYEPLPPMP